MGKITLRFRLVRLLPALAVVAASCAFRNDAAGSLPAGGGGPPEGEVEGSLLEPLGDAGVQVPDAASADLPFSPVQPTKLGDPVRVIAASAELQTSAIAWVFDDPELGEFAVVERVDDWTEAGLKVEASPVPSPGCTTQVVETSSSPASLVRCAYNNSYLTTLNGGRIALVTAGDSFSVTTWIEPLVVVGGAGSDSELNVVVDVMGPTTVFSPDQAVKVANMVASPN
jgi:hypothetical protein